MNRLMIIAALTLFSASLLADDDKSLIEEKWSCKPRYSDQGVKVTLKSAYFEDKDGLREYLPVGEVIFRGVKSNTVFEIEGLNLRWDWKNQSNSERVENAFMIDPENDGMYYNFSSSGQSKPSMLFNCKSKKEVLK